MAKMILVLGSGRSGTSEVAEILEKLGVFMGSRFHRGDHFNKRGYWEDKDFQEINFVFSVMKPDNEKLWELWREKFKMLVETRKEPWGVKDPGIADFPELLREYMKLNPLVILCSRDKDDTIRSLQRFKNIPQNRAKAIYKTRLDNFHAQVKDYLEVDCYDGDKEEKIKSWLTNKNVV